MDPYAGPNLTIDQVRRIVTEQFPDLADADVAFAGNGGDFDVFRVAGCWMFRFPKGPDRELCLLQEIALLDAIDPKLPVACPRYMLLGRRSRLLPLRFGAYLALPGEIAAHLELPDHWRRGAEILGRIVNVLHELDPARVPGFGAAAAELETPAVWRAAALDDLADPQDLDPTLHRACIEFLRDDARVPAPYDGPPRLVHGDLGPEHLLVNPAACTLTGVIDWTDASLADPASDFAKLWAWRGDAFVEAMLRHYAQPIDAGLWQRIRYGGVCTAINYAYGVAGNIHRYRESGRSWLRRIFRL